MLPFIVGVGMASAFGYTDAVTLTTIGAGAVTYIVGPVTGTAIGASSDVIALSIATGVIKAIIVMIATPAAANFMRLKTPRSAMVFGGLAGTVSGVSAGLAATDRKLVPYGRSSRRFTPASAACSYHRFSFSQSKPLSDTERKTRAAKLERPRSSGGRLRKPGKARTPSKRRDRASNSLHFPACAIHRPWPTRPCV